MAKKTVVAAMTIETGTPAKPKTIAKGESFDIDADDPENLIGRGIVIDPDAKVAEAAEEEPAVKPAA
jgi:hypothetical protein